MRKTLTRVLAAGVVAAGALAVPVGGAAADPLDCVPAIAKIEGKQGGGAYCQEGMGFIQVRITCLREADLKKYIKTGKVIWSSQQKVSDAYCNGHDAYKSAVALLS